MGDGMRDNAPPSSRGVDHDELTAKPIAQIDGCTTQQLAQKLRAYWDGVPVPQFTLQPSGNIIGTFSFRLLAFVPDYRCDTQAVPISPAAQLDELQTWCAERSHGLFTPLAVVHSSAAPSVSARIASHYSPLAGTFRFSIRGKNGSGDRTAKGKQLGSSVSFLGPTLPHPTLSSLPARNIVRIPAMACRDEVYTVDVDSSDRDATRLRDAHVAEYQRRLRLACLMQLYAPLLSEALPCPAGILERIRQRSLRGLRNVNELWIAREMAILSAEHTRAHSEAVYYYCCKNTLFVALLAPLCLPVTPEYVRPPRLCCQESAKAQSDRRARMAQSREALMASILFSSGSSAYLAKVHACWEKNFQSLILFDLAKGCHDSSSINVSIDFATLLRQLEHSMRAAFTNIGVMLYMKLENLFFSTVKDVHTVLTMSKESYMLSPFHRVLVATRVYLARQLRCLVMAELGRLVSFFVMGEQYSRLCTLDYARKTFPAPLLRAEFVMTSSFMPFNVPLSSFQEGMYDLFHELWQNCNSLPCPEYAIMRDHKITQRCMHIVDYDEVVCARAAVMATIAPAVRAAECLTRVYARYTTLSVVTQHTCTDNDACSSVYSQVQHARRVISAIHTKSSDTVCCGRFLLDMTAARKAIVQLWQRFLEKCFAQIRQRCMSAIHSLDCTCQEAMRKLQHAPTTVAEVETLSTHITTTRKAATQLILHGCPDIIAQISLMERANVVVTQELREASQRAMEWPAKLDQAVNAAEKTAAQRRPELLIRTRQLRRSIAEYMNTLSAGVVELYNMFNLDICDIAVQTCTELKYVVEQVTSSVDRLVFEEKALGVHSDSSLGKLYPQLRHLDTISLFWTTINEIGNLCKYYSCPVKALNAQEMMNRVRSWRRALHYTTRQLRGFASLRQLGEQQEGMLTRFEELNELLTLLTSRSMRKSHWKEVARSLGVSSSEDNTAIADLTITLQRLLDLGAVQRLHHMRRIASQAQADEAVETGLEHMQSLAKKTFFCLKEICPMEDEEDMQMKSATPFATHRAHAIAQSTDSAHRCRIVTPSCLARLNTLIGDCAEQCQQLRCRVGRTSSAMAKALTTWECGIDHAHDVIGSWAMLQEKWVIHSATLATLHATTTASQSNGSRCENSSAPFSHEHMEMDDCHRRHEEQKQQQRERERCAIMALTPASRIWDSLCNLVSKPHFSLHMAILQEAVTELLLELKDAMTQAESSLLALLPYKRARCARFHLVPDAQLMTFLSVFNIVQLRRLLPFMYARLTSVYVKQGGVVSFVTADGAVLHACQPLPITAHYSTEEWMNMFDRAVCIAMHASMRRCQTALTQMTLSQWLLCRRTNIHSSDRIGCARNSATTTKNKSKTEQQEQRQKHEEQQSEEGVFSIQEMIMALRAEHTRDVREVIMTSRNSTRRVVRGLRTYQRRLRCMMEECDDAVHRAQPSLTPCERHRVAAVIQQIQLTYNQIHLLLRASLENNSSNHDSNANDGFANSGNTNSDSSNIVNQRRTDGMRTVDDLDSTTMVQTFLGDTPGETFVRVLGISHVYGFEFWGNSIPAIIADEVPDVHNESVSLSTSSSSSFSPLLLQSFSIPQQQHFLLLFMRISTSVAQRVTALYEPEAAASFSTTRRMIDATGYLLGRFVMHMVCGPWMQSSSVVSVLRAMASVGGLFSLHGCERASCDVQQCVLSCVHAMEEQHDVARRGRCAALRRRDVQEQRSECSKTVHTNSITITTTANHMYNEEMLMWHCQLPGITAGCPVASKTSASSTSLWLPVHNSFHVVLTTSVPFAQLPRTLCAQYRTIAVPHESLAALVRTHLGAYSFLHDYNPDDASRCTATAPHQYHTDIVHRSDTANQVEPQQQQPQPQHRANDNRYHTCDSADHTSLEQCDVSTRFAWMYAQLRAMHGSVFTLHALVAAVQLALSRAIRATHRDNNNRPSEGGSHTDVHGLSDGARLPCGRTVMQLLLDAFCDHFAWALRDMAVVRAVVQWNITHTLLIGNKDSPKSKNCTTPADISKRNSSSGLSNSSSTNNCVHKSECNNSDKDRLYTAEQDTKDLMGTVYHRFDEVMTAAFAHHHHEQGSNRSNERSVTPVCLVGPAYSGKSSLWRRWVRAQGIPTEVRVICPALMSTEEFYDNILATMAAPPPPAPWGSPGNARQRVIVIEDDASDAAMTLRLQMLNWPRNCRVMTRSAWASSCYHDIMTRNDSNPTATADKNNDSNTNSNTGRSQVTNVEDGSESNTHTEAAPPHDTHSTTNTANNIGITKDSSHNSKRHCYDSDAAVVSQPICLLLSTSHLHHATPRMMSEFALFHLHERRSWKEVLWNCLTGCCGSVGIVYTVMLILLPRLVRAAHAQKSSGKRKSSTHIFYLPDPELPEHQSAPSEQRDDDEQQQKQDSEKYAHLNEEQRHRTQVWTRKRDVAAQQCCRAATSRCWAELSPACVRAVGLYTRWFRYLSNYCVLPLPSSTTRSECAVSRQCTPARHRGRHDVRRMDTNSSGTKTRDVIYTGHTNSTNTTSTLSTFTSPNLVSDSDSDTDAHTSASSSTQPSSASSAASVSASCTDNSSELSSLFGLSHTRLSAQCAVQAILWAVGLGVPIVRQRRVVRALHRSRATLARILQDDWLAECILPPSANAEDKNESKEQSKRDNKHERKEADVDHSEGALHAPRRRRQPQDVAQHSACAVIDDADRTAEQFHTYSRCHRYRSHDHHDYSYRFFGQHESDDGAMWNRDYDEVDGSSEDDASDKDDDNGEEDKDGLALFDMVVTRVGWLSLRPTDGPCGAMTGSSRYTSYSTVPAAARGGLPLTWSHDNPYPTVVSGQANRYSSSANAFFMLPSRMTILSVVECLLNCGQGVLLCAAAGSGKTAILQRARECERWVTQLCEASTAMDATVEQMRVARVFIQPYTNKHDYICQHDTRDNDINDDCDTVHKSKSNSKSMDKDTAENKFADGASGSCSYRFARPPRGRTLVLCIDDVHLSAATNYRAARLAAYCQMHQSLCTPATQGVMPITRTVVLATVTTDTSAQDENDTHDCCNNNNSIYNTMQSSSNPCKDTRSMHHSNANECIHLLNKVCVCVRLPPLRGSELGCVVRCALEEVCRTRHSDVVAEVVGRYLLSVHALFVQQLRSCTRRAALSTQNSIVAASSLFDSSTTTTTTTHPIDHATNDSSSCNKCDRVLEETQYLACHWDMTAHALACACVRLCQHPGEMDMYAVSVVLVTLYRIYDSALRAMWEGQQQTGRTAQLHAPMQQKDTFFSCHYKPHHMDEASYRRKSEAGHDEHKDDTSSYSFVSSASASAAVEAKGEGLVTALSALRSGALASIRRVLPSAYASTAASTFLTATPQPQDERLHTDITEFEMESVVADMTTMYACASTADEQQEVLLDGWGLCPIHGGRATLHGMHTLCNNTSRHNNNNGGCYSKRKQPKNRTSRTSTSRSRNNSIIPNHISSALPHPSTPNSLGGCAAYAASAVCHSLHEPTHTGAVAESINTRASAPYPTRSHKRTSRDCCCALRLSTLTHNTPQVHTTQNTARRRSLLRRRHRASAMVESMQSDLNATTYVARSASARGVATRRASLRLAHMTRATLDGDADDVQRAKEELAHSLRSVRHTCVTPWFRQAVSALYRCVTGGERATRRASGVSSSHIFRFASSATAATSPSRTNTSTSAKANTNTTPIATSANFSSLSLSPATSTTDTTTAAAAASFCSTTTALPRVTEQVGLRVPSLLQPTHLFLLSPTRFSLHRMVALVCHAKHMPLAVLRTTYSPTRRVWSDSSNDSSVASTYFHKARMCDGHTHCRQCALARLKRELRAVIRFALTNRVRVVVYVTHAVIMQLHGAAELLDSVLGHGDVGALFTRAERRSLQCGFYVSPRRTLTERASFASLTSASSYFGSSARNASSSSSLAAATAVSSLTVSLASAGASAADAAHARMQNEHVESDTLSQRVQQSVVLLTHVRTQEECALLRQRNALFAHMPLPLVLRSSHDDAAKARWEWVQCCLNECAAIATASAPLRSSASASSSSSSLVERAALKDWLNVLQYGALARAMCAVAQYCESMWGNSHCACAVRETPTTAKDSNRGSCTSMRGDENASSSALADLSGVQRNDGMQRVSDDNINYTNAIQKQQNDCAPLHCARCTRRTAHTQHRTTSCALCSARGMNAHSMIRLACFARYVAHLFLTVAHRRITHEKQRRDIQASEFDFYPFFADCSATFSLGLAQASGAMGRRCRAAARRSAKARRATHQAHVSSRQAAQAAAHALSTHAQCQLHHDVLAQACAIRCARARVTQAGRRLSRVKAAEVRAMAEARVRGAALWRGLAALVKGCSVLLREASANQSSNTSTNPSHSTNSNEMNVADADGRWWWALFDELYNVHRQQENVGSSNVDSSGNHNANATTTTTTTIPANHNTNSHTSRVGMSSMKNRSHISLEASKARDSSNNHDASMNDHDTSCLAGHKALWTRAKPHLCTTACATALSITAAPMTQGTPSHATANALYSIESDLRSAHFPSAWRWAKVVWEYLITVMDYCHAVLNDVPSMSVTSHTIYDTCANNSGRKKIMNEPDDNSFYTSTKYSLAHRNDTNADKKARLGGKGGAGMHVSLRDAHNAGEHDASGRMHVVVPVAANSLSSAPDSHSAQEDQHRRLTTTRAETHGACSGEDDETAMSAAAQALASASAQLALANKDADHAAARLRTATVTESQRRSVWSALQSRLCQLRVCEEQWRRYKVVRERFTAYLPDSLETDNGTHQMNSRPMPAKDYTTASTAATAASSLMSDTCDRAYEDSTSNTALHGEGAESAAASRAAHGNQSDNAEETRIRAAAAESVLTAAYVMFILPLSPQPHYTYSECTSTTSCFSSSLQSSNALDLPRTNYAHERDNKSHSHPYRSKGCAESHDADDERVEVLRRLLTSAHGLACSSVPSPKSHRRVRECILPFFLTSPITQAAVDELYPVCLPTRHRTLLAAMMSDAVMPMPVLLGGVCARMEQLLLTLLKLRWRLRRQQQQEQQKQSANKQNPAAQQLNETNTSSVILTSATTVPQRRLRRQLCTAMQRGSTLVVRDVTHPRALPLLRPLAALWPSLRAARQQYDDQCKANVLVHASQSNTHAKLANSDNAGNDSSSTGTDKGSSATEGIPFRIFGNTIVVNIFFELVAISSAFVEPCRCMIQYGNENTSEEDEDDTTAWMSICNLGPLPFSSLSFMATRAKAKTSKEEENAEAPCYVSDCEHDVDYLLLPTSMAVWQQLHETLPRLSYACNVAATALVQVYNDVRNRATAAATMLEQSSSSSDADNDSIATIHSSTTVPRSSSSGSNLANDNSNQEECEGGVTGLAESAVTKDRRCRTSLKPQDETCSLNRDATTLNNAPCDISFSNASAVPVTSERQSSLLEWSEDNKESKCFTEDDGEVAAALEQSCNRLDTLAALEHVLLENCAAAAEAVSRCEQRGGYSSNSSNSSSENAMHVALCESHAAAVSIVIDLLAASARACGVLCGQHSLHAQQQQHQERSRRAEQAMHQHEHVLHECYDRSPPDEGKEDTCAYCVYKKQLWPCVRRWMNDWMFDPDHSFSWSTALFRVLRLADRTLRCFSRSWPAPLRHSFGLLAVQTILHAYNVVVQEQQQKQLHECNPCATTSTQLSAVPASTTTAASVTETRAKPSSTKIELAHHLWGDEDAVRRCSAAGAGLTAAQLHVLRDVLCGEMSSDGVDAAYERIRCRYVRSEDALLSRIVDDLCSPSEDVYKESMSSQHDNKNSTKQTREGTRRISTENKNNCKDSITTDTDDAAMSKLGRGSIGNACFDPVTSYSRWPHVSIDLSRSGNRKDDHKTDVERFFVALAQMDLTGVESLSAQMLRRIFGDACAVLPRVVAETCMVAEGHHSELTQHEQPTQNSIPDSVKPRSARRRRTTIPLAADAKYDAEAAMLRPTMLHGLHWCSSAGAGIPVCLPVAATARVPHEPTMPHNTHDNTVSQSHDRVGARRDDTRKSYNSGSYRNVNGRKSNSPIDEHAKDCSEDPFFASMNDTTGAEGGEWYARAALYSHLWKLRRLSQLARWQFHWRDAHHVDDVEAFTQYMLTLCTTTTMTMRSLFQQDNTASWSTDMHRPCSSHCQANVTCAYNTLCVNSNSRGSSGMPWSNNNTCTTNTTDDCNWCGGTDYRPRGDMLVLVVQEEVIDVCDAVRRSLQRLFALYQNRCRVGVRGGLPATTRQTGRTRSVYSSSNHCPYANHDSGDCIGESNHYQGGDGASEGSDEDDSSGSEHRAAEENVGEDGLCGDQGCAKSFSGVGLTTTQSTPWSVSLVLLCTWRTYRVLRDGGMTGEWGCLCWPGDYLPRMCTLAHSDRTANVHFCSKTSRDCQAHHCHMPTRQEEDCHPTHASRNSRLPSNDGNGTTVPAVESSVHHAPGKGTIPAACDVVSHTRMSCNSLVTVLPMTTTSMPQRVCALLCDEVVNDMYDAVVSSCTTAPTSPEHKHEHDTDADTCMRTSSHFSPASHVVSGQSQASYGIVYDDAVRHAGKMSRLHERSLSIRRAPAQQVRGRHVCAAPHCGSCRVFLYADAHDLIRTRAGFAHSSAAIAADDDFAKRMACCAPRGCSPLLDGSVDEDEEADADECEESLESGACEESSECAVQASTLHVPSTHVRLPSAHATEDVVKHGSHDRRRHVRTVRRVMRQVALEQLMRHLWWTRIGELRADVDVALTGMTCQMTRCPYSNAPHGIVTDETETLAMVLELMKQWAQQAVEPCVACFSFSSWRSHQHPASHSQCNKQPEPFAAAAGAASSSLPAARATVLNRERPYSNVRAQGQQQQHLSVVNSYTTPHLPALARMLYASRRRRRQSWWWIRQDLTALSRKSVCMTSAQALRRVGAAVMYTAHQAWLSAPSSYCPPHQFTDGRTSSATTRTARRLNAIASTAAAPVSLFPLTQPALSMHATAPTTANKSLTRNDTEKDSFYTADPVQHSGQRLPNSIFAHRLRQNRSSRDGGTTEAPQSRGSDALTVLSFACAGMKGPLWRWWYNTVTRTDDASFRDLFRWDGIDEDMAAAMHDWIRRTRWRWLAVSAQLQLCVHEVHNYTIQTCTGLTAAAKFTLPQHANTVSLADDATDSIVSPKDTDTGVFVRDSAEDARLPCVSDACTSTVSVSAARMAQLNRAGATALIALLEESSTSTASLATAHSRDQALNSADIAESQLTTVDNNNANGSDHNNRDGSNALCSSTVHIQDASRSWNVAALSYPRLTLALLLFAGSTWTRSIATAAAERWLSSPPTQMDGCDATSVVMLLTPCMSVLQSQDVRLDGAVLSPWLQHTIHSHTGWDIAGLWRRNEQRRRYVHDKTKASFTLSTKADFTNTTTSTSSNRLHNRNTHTIYNSDADRTNTSASVTKRDTSSCDMCTRADYVVALRVLPSASVRALCRRSARCSTAVPRASPQIDAEGRHSFQWTDMDTLQWDECDRMNSGAVCATKPPIRCWVSTTAMPLQQRVCANSATVTSSAAAAARADIASSQVSVTTRELSCMDKTRRAASASAELWATLACLPLHVMLPEDPDASSDLSRSCTRYKTLPTGTVGYYVNLP